MANLITTVIDKFTLKKGKKNEEEPIKYLKSYFSKDEKATIKQWLEENEDVNALKFVINPEYLSANKKEQYFGYQYSKNYDDFIENGGAVSNIWHNLQHGLLEIRSENVSLDNILCNAKARHIQKLRTIALSKDKANAEKAIRKVNIYLDEQKAKDAIRSARKLAVNIEKENRLAYAKHKKTMKKILKTIVKIHNSKVKDSKKVKQVKKKNNKKKNKTKSA